jgi:hypothetical protein
MKVDIEIGKSGSVIVKVDDYVLDVTDELRTEVIADVEKKYVWLSSLAYEIERRYTKLTEGEKRACMAHWNDWAVRWLKARDINQTSDLIGNAVAHLFGEATINQKVQYLHEVSCMMLPLKKKNYERWSDFFNDPAVSDNLKETCRKMFSLELERNQDYDKMVMAESKLHSIVQTLKACAQGYKLYAERRRIR